MNNNGWTARTGGKGAGGGSLNASSVSASSGSDRISLMAVEGGLATSVPEAVVVVVVVVKVVGPTVVVVVDVSNEPVDICVIGRFVFELSSEVSAIFTAVVVAVVVVVFVLALSSFGEEGAMRSGALPNPFGERMERKGGEGADLDPSGVPDGV